MKIIDLCRWDGFSLDAIPHVFHPPREPIDEVMPPRGIEGMGPYILRRGLAGEPVQGTDPHRVRHGDHGALLPPAGRPAGVQGRQGRHRGARRGVGQLREDRPQGLVPRPSPARALLARLGGVARRHPRPRRPAGRGAKASHVDPGLGHPALRPRGSPPEAYPAA